jgi:transcriptional regulator GlxA family with amidase domain
MLQFVYSSLPECTRTTMQVANSVQDARGAACYPRGMKRKNALVTVATLVGGFTASSTILAAASGSSKARNVALVHNLGKPLHPPAHAPVRVGVVIGPDLVAIDMFGPWAAFRAASLGSNMKNTPLFDSYAISATTEPLDVDGLRVQPQYSFGNAPQPHVLVVPNQRSLPETIAYVKEAGVHADVTMSVCTGAFIVGMAGLFDGLKATTHHSAYGAFEQLFPKVTLVRGPKYVEEPNVSSSGGETSGIDLALRVVERYYGGEVAKSAAYAMEYRRIARPQSTDEV